MEKDLLSSFIPDIELNDKSGVHSSHAVSSFSPHVFSSFVSQRIFAIRFKAHLFNPEIMFS